MGDSSLDSMLGVIPVVVVGGVAMKFADYLLPPKLGSIQAPKPLIKHVRKVGKTSIKHKGKTYRRYKAGYSPWDKEEQGKTGDKKAFLCECGAEYGQYHLLGCDLEQDPICKGQLLSCGHGPLFETASVRNR